MSENNEYYWQVESKVYGGQGYSTATREEYKAVAKALDQEASEFKKLASVWETEREQLDIRHVAATCREHTALPYTVLKVRCQEHADACRQISENLSLTAERLLRVLGLYSDAELIAKRLFNEVLQFATQVKPHYAAAAATALGVGGFLTNWAIEGKPNPWSVFTATYPIHEGLMSGLGSFIGRVPRGLGALTTDETNRSAGVLAQVTAPMKNLWQGNHLNVREVTTKADVVRSSQSVAESMDGLYRLANERLGKIDLDSGLDYATIAVQRYERADGTNAWLVTIPGTDGQPDSPFGWMQNLELMSPSERQSMEADSARMVIEAMRQAGIDKDEPVAMVGHSQGGIVAATIASNWADDYNIEHIVTAGSPIANHAIPKKTWVTSVEMDTEFVAALDGTSNPATPTWLTVKGTASRAPDATPSTINKDGSCTPGSTPIAGDAPYDAAPVKGGPSSEMEITHWLQYHQAAYQNATDEGSPAIQNHERHFQNIIQGELKETRYFEGRMSHRPLEPKIVTSEPDTSIPNVQLKIQE